MGQPVVHFEIAAKDPDKVRDFYQKIFDWNINSNNPFNYGVVDTESNEGIDGGIMPIRPEVPAYLTFYVEVDNLQSYLDKVRSLGGKTEVPPTPIPNVGSIAMFRDPEGNLVGLFHGEEGT